MYLLNVNCSKNTLILKLHHEIEYYMVCNENKEMKDKLIEGILYIKG